MKKLIITLLSALCIPIFAETNAPIVLTEELVPYALNTNVVHASHDSDGYFINDGISVNGLKVGNEEDGQFTFTIDSGELTYNGLESSITYGLPYILGDDSIFIYGQDSEGSEFSLGMPSDSDGKYLALTTNNTGHITYDEIIGTPSIDLSSYASITQLNNSLLNLAPEYSSSTIYTNGDYCIYSGLLYECTNYTGSASSFIQNNWKRTTVTKIVGNINSILHVINGGN